MLRKVLSLATAALLGACTVVGVRAGTEEPAHAVIERHGPLEIRRYGPRLAAETVAAGPEEEARSAGFRALARYIFGANRPAGRIAMTAPVEQQSIAMTAPVAQQRIAMTAPVAQGPAGPEGWRIRFFMPASWTAETLPVPEDPAVTIVTVPAETVAVLRFSGRPTPATVAAQRTALLRALEATPWQPVGAIQDWFYDPPWTLPAARRNEVAVPVVRRSG